MPLKINLSLLIVNLVKENFKGYSKLKKAFIYNMEAFFVLSKVVNYLFIIKLHTF